MRALRLSARHFVQNRIPQAPHNPWIQNRKQDLHAPVEIARHQIRAAHVNFFVPAVLEIVQAAVFEKPPDNARDRDVLADARNSGPQAAQPADDQIDPHSRARRLVKKLDHRPVFERVHLENQPSARAVFHFAPYQRRHPLAQRHGRHQQLAEIRPYANTPSDN